MNLNTAIIAGRLTRDPELKALPSGVEICNFSLATSSVYTDRDGNKQETTEYHNIVVYGKSATNAAKYLVKGQVALVQGRLTTRSWDKDGVKMYRTEIAAERVQFGPKAGGETTRVEKSPALPDYPEDEINPEDIPF